ncbi:hypothetical protein [Reichenbachiella sp.]|uniref:hypothetical protein n=1 Tax=Reichenbachiella sp. TaxID=2184521 RepID=UPI003B59A035
MDLQAEKYALIEELMKVEDIKIVKDIKSILQNRKTVLGYDPDGKAVTSSKLRSDVLAAKQRINSGQFTTQEDLESEAENW